MAISLLPSMQLDLDSQPFSQNVCATPKLLGLDKSGDTIFVSHAHTDHAGALRATVPAIATSETLAIAGFGQVKGTKLNEQSSINEYNFELLNAGHILGSSMLHIQNGSSLLYTGDFNNHDSLLLKGAEPKEVDTLLIESTYGSPEWLLPDQKEVYEEIAKWAQETLAKNSIGLIGGYAIGKSQEIIAILNKYANISPVVSGKVEQVCKVYEQFGQKLKRKAVETFETEKSTEEAFIAVMPYHKVTRLEAIRIHQLYGKPVYTAATTGWAVHYRMPTDFAFPLSDHADFNGLLEFVEACNPKKVITCLGQNITLAKELKKKGWNASTIKNIDQKQLCEF